MVWNCLTVLLLTLLPISGRGHNLERDVPFELAEGFIWLEVRTPKTERPLSFILDTGASVSVLDFGVISELGLRKGLKVAVDGVGTRSTGLWPQRLLARSGDLVLPRQYLALDLKKLSRSSKRQVDGLLGMDFFRDKIVQIDYTNRRLRILADKSANLSGVELPLTIRRCGMLVPVLVGNNSPASLRVDTGCASWLHWVTESVNITECSPRSAVGLLEMSLPVTQTSITVGEITFHGIPAEIHHQPIFPGESGLLGNQLLAEFSAVTFDVPGKRLILHGQPKTGALR